MSSTVFNSTLFDHIMPLDTLLTVDNTNNLTSITFNAFTDELTDECGIVGDCHSQLSYRIEYYYCNTCDDETSCDNNCDDWATSGGDYAFYNQTADEYWIAFNTSFTG